MASNTLTNSPIDVLVMGCADGMCDFKPMRVQRRAVGDEDVLFDLKYCGVCHTDLHASAGHLDGFQKTVYPCIPGHELAGVVTAVGQSVKKFKVGDHVGVGCMVDSCLKCKNCKAGDENKCMKQVGTYQGKDLHGRAGLVAPTQRTMGGYTTKMVVHEHFAIKIPQTYPLEAAGPIMCAGVTMFEPLKVYGATTGTHVGIVGLGGLGMTGIKIAKALGCTVTAISRAPGPKEQQARTAGATDFIASGDPAEMKKRTKSLDLILNTIPVDHNEKVYMALLTPTGNQVMLGLTRKLIGTFIAMQTPCGSGRLKASGIGGIPNTQEVIDLCDKHKIVPELKVCPVSELNQIYETLDSGNDSGLRFVLDIANTLNEDAFEQCTAAPPKIYPNYKGPSMCGICCHCCRTCCCRCCC